MLTGAGRGIPSSSDRRLPSADDSPDHRAARPELALDALGSRGDGLDVRNVRRHGQGATTSIPDFLLRGGQAFLATEQKSDSRAALCERVRDGPESPACRPPD